MSLPCNCLERSYGEGMSYNRREGVFYNRVESRNMLSPPGSEPTFGIERSGSCDFCRGAPTAGGSNINPGLKPSSLASTVMCMPTV